MWKIYGQDTYLIFWHTPIKYLIYALSLIVVQSGPRTLVKCCNNIFESGKMIHQKFSADKCFAEPIFTASAPNDLWYLALCFYFTQKI